MCGDRIQLQTSQIARELLEFKVGNPLIPLILRISNDNRVIEFMDLLVISVYA